MIKIFSPQRRGEHGVGLENEVPCSLDKDEEQLPEIQE
jgi:hypothetical protein